MVNCAVNEAGLRRLASAGYVKFDADLQLASAALEREIDVAELAPAEIELAKSKTSGVWNTIRAPFYTLLGFAIVAVIVAAPNALSSTMTVLAASAGGVGVIVQIMNLMLRGK